MSGKIVAEAMLLTTRWGLKHRLGQLSGLVKGRQEPEDRRPPVTTNAPMRRRLLLPLLVVGFIVISVAEVWLLTAVGSVIGVPWTLVILVAEALVGAWLMRREGRKAWAALTDAYSTGRMPTGQLADAALVLVGGIMLILPGFFTDVIGLFCLLPFTRPLARRFIGLIVARHVSKQGLDIDVMRARFAPDTVIKGETVDTPPTEPDERPAGHQGRDRGLIPQCSSPRISSSRSASRSSSSSMERRSRSMSQWVRATLVSFGSEVDTIGALARLAAARALPLGGQVRLLCEDHCEVVALRAVEPDLLTWRQFDPTRVGVALRHPVRIPSTRDSQPLHSLRSQLTSYGQTQSTFGNAFPASVIPLRMSTRVSRTPPTTKKTARATSASR